MSPDPTPPPSAAATYDATVQAMREADAPKTDTPAPQGPHDVYGAIPEATLPTPPPEKKPIPAAALDGELRNLIRAQEETNALTVQLQARLYSQGLTVDEGGNLVPLQQPPPQVAPPTLPEQPQAVPPQAWAPQAPVGQPETYEDVAAALDTWAQGQGLPPGRLQQFITAQQHQANLMSAQAITQTFGRELENHLQSKIARLRADDSAGFKTIEKTLTESLAHPLIRLKAAVGRWGVSAGRQHVPRGALGPARAAGCRHDRRPVH